MWWVTLDLHTMNKVATCTTVHSERTMWCILPPWKLSISSARVYNKHQVQWDPGGEGVVQTPLPLKMGTGHPRHYANIPNTWGRGAGLIILLAEPCGRAPLTHRSNGIHPNFISPNYPASSMKNISVVGSVGSSRRKLCRSSPTQYIMEL